MKQKRLVEIETKAARVANLARAQRGDTELLGGPSDSESNLLPQDDAAQTNAYKLIEELAGAMCEAFTKADLTDARVNGLKTPGTGKDVNWLFTSVEIRAGEKKCRVILPLIEERNGMRA